MAEKSLHDRLAPSKHSSGAGVVLDVQMQLFRMHSRLWMILLVAFVSTWKLSRPACAQPHGGCDVENETSGHWPFYGSQDEVQDMWVNHGRDLENSRWAKFETQISRSKVANLRVKWEFETSGDVTATPSIADGVVYFPDWLGFLYAVNQYTGAVVWKKNLTALAPELNFNLTISRTTPVIAGQRLIVGIYGPSAILALNRTNGELLWSQIVDTHPSSVITMSGTAYNGYYYVGTSSREEGTHGVCCSFQGAFLKLNLRTGEIVWRTRMAPDNGGRTDLYAGNALWGSSPPIDKKRRKIYIATGNNYHVPQEVLECEENYLNQTDPPIPDPCLADDNHLESVLSLDLDTGAIAWAKRLGGYDVWLVVCLSPDRSPNCPKIEGPDYDFGMAPLLLTIPTSVENNYTCRYAESTLCTRDVLIIGQKSGIIWALDRESGDTVWSQVAGPGGTLGGASWGMATDGERVFTNIINNDMRNFTLVPTSQVVKTGGWAALNATTGHVLWSISGNGRTQAPVTHANGVVFGAVSTAPGTGFYALDANTGNVLKSFTFNSTSVSGGSSVLNGCVFIPLGVTPVGVTSATFGNQTFAHGHSVVAACV